MSGLRPPLERIGAAPGADPGSGHPSGGYGFRDPIIQSCLPHRLARSAAASYDRSGGVAALDGGLAARWLTSLGGLSTAIISRRARLPFLRDRRPCSATVGRAPPDSRHRYQPARGVRRRGGIRRPDARRLCSTNRSCQPIGPDTSSASLRSAAGIRSDDRQGIAGRTGSRSQASRMFPRSF